jgi:hypothetical protein
MRKTPWGWSGGIGRWREMLRAGWPRSRIPARRRQDGPIPTRRLARKTP